MKFIIRLKQVVFCGPDMQMRQLSSEASFNANNVKGRLWTFINKGIRLSGICIVWHGWMCVMNYLLCVMRSFGCLRPPQDKKGFSSYKDCKSTGNWTIEKGGNCINKWIYCTGDIIIYMLLIDYECKFFLSVHFCTYYLTMYTHGKGSFEKDSLLLCDPCSSG